VLTGIEVPAMGKRSTELGVQCFNVARPARVARLAFGEPLISRIVTLAGNVERPRNWEVRSARRSRDLVALGGPESRHRSLHHGRPDDGLRLPAIDAPVVKATNCIWPLRRRCSRRARRRCRASAVANAPKPARPSCSLSRLYWFSRARNFGKTQEYHLFDCIECGCCSYVCPSHIPLVQYYYRFAKSEIWAREREKNGADAAKARFELRNAREEREQAEKAARLAKGAAARAAEKQARAVVAVEPAAADSAADSAVSVASPQLKPADAPAPVAAIAPASLAPREAPAPELDAEAIKKATIVAAMERARAQRAAVQPKNTDQLTFEQKRQLAAVDARRAALQAEELEEAAEPGATRASVETPKQVEKQGRTGE
jgi:electron transport complex protein RnfC